VDRYYLLPNRRDHFVVLIKEREVKTDDVALNLPVKSLDICNIFNNVEQFIGKSELPPVRHRDIVLLMKAYRLFLQMCHLLTVSIKDISLAANDDDRRLCPIQNLSLFVLYFNSLVQIARIQFGIQRADRCAEFCFNILMEKALNGGLIDDSPASYSDILRNHGQLISKYYEKRKYQILVYNK